MWLACSRCDINHPVMPAPICWKDFFNFLMKWEGAVWENDPDDHGNRGDGSPGNIGTKYGVDSRSHPGVNIRELTLEGAEKIYLKEYEDSVASSLPYPFNYLFFDFEVNAGPARAVKCLQKVSGVNADGAWGPISKKAFSLVSEQKNTTSKYLQCRRDFYNDLADGSKRLSKYRKGWLNRTNDLGKVLNVT